MTALIYVCTLSSLVLGIYAFQPNCDPFNQFRNFCFWLEYCDAFDCYSSPCGRFGPYSILVRINETKVIPKCAFTNSESLETIEGKNSAIEILASGSFINLTGNNLQIDLSFNRIKELHSGIFENVLAYSLDFSWNKILYIQEGAFEGLPNLTSLNLSKNDLTTFPIQQIPPKLSVLDLSYNFLNEAILTSRRMPGLNEINLSNNKLKRIALSLDNPVNKIDLFDNRLENFDLIELPQCEELSIGKNKFRSTPPSLSFLNLRKISLYPNPWKCEELQNLWTTLQNNFVTLVENKKSNSTDEHSPLCSADTETTLPKQNLLSRFKSDDRQECVDDSDCREDSICRSSKCWNPCKYQICETSETCIIEKHKVKCSCPTGTKKDHRIYHSECKNVECYSNTDCPLIHYCNDANKCISFGDWKPGSAGYGGYASPASSGGFPGGSVGSGGSLYPISTGGNDGSSGSYPSNSANSFPGSAGGIASSPGGFQVENAGSDGSYGSGNSGSYGGYASGFQSGYGGGYDTYPTMDKNEWWRYEIPESKEEKNEKKSSVV